MNKEDSGFRELYPMLSDEELVEAEDRLRRYLALALDTLDDLASAGEQAAVDNSDLTS